MFLVQPSYGEKGYEEEREERRSDARAKMRVMIRKLLRKYHYPPEGMDDAIKTVMPQCELWADNLEFDTPLPLSPGNTLSPKTRRTAWRQSERMSAKRGLTLSGRAAG